MRHEFSTNRKRGREGRLYAGGDWSGKPGRTIGTRDIFSFCLVSHRDLSAVEERFARLKREMGMRADEEFHGHSMNHARLAAVLETILAMDMRIGILIVDKSAVLMSGRLVLLSPTRFTHEIAVRLIKPFVADEPLARVWLDEDIDGKAAQQSFKTDVLRVQRARHPASTCGVVFKRSHASIMIQLADVVAYVLSRQARKVRFEPVLENAVRKLRSDSRHLILEPTAWED